SLCAASPVRSASIDAQGLRNRNSSYFLCSKHISGRIVGNSETTRQGILAEGDASNLFFKRSRAADRMSVSLLRSFLSLLIVWRIARSRVCREVRRRRNVGTRAPAFPRDAKQKG